MGLRQTLVPNSLVLVEGTDPKGPRQDAPALGINASSAHGGEGSLMCGPGLHTCLALAQITSLLAAATGIASTDLVSSAGQPGQLTAGSGPGNGTPQPHMAHLKPPSGGGRRLQLEPDLVGKELKAWLAVYYYCYHDGITPPAMWP